MMAAHLWYIVGIITTLSVCTTRTAPLLECNEGLVVQTYEFEKPPICPPVSGHPGSVATQNGTVYIFKPNLNYAEIAATSCIKRITRVRASIHCFLRGCTGHHVQRTILDHSIPPEECQSWIRKKRCDSCGLVYANADANDQKPDKCKLELENADEVQSGRSRWATHVGTPTSYQKVWFGDSVKVTDYANCIVEQGFIRVINPWKTLVSGWGVLHDTEQLETGVAGVSREEGRTVVWDPPKSPMCNYVLHSDNIGHTVRFDELNDTHYIVVPALTTTFPVQQILARDDPLLSEEHHSSCLNVILAKSSHTRAFKTDGDLVLVFVPSGVNGTITLRDNTTVDIHHKLKGLNASATDILNNDTDNNHRTKREITGETNAVTAVDVQAEFEDAHLQYFIDALETHDYQNAVELAYRLCREQSEIYRQWVIQARISPSLVLSHFLNHTVVAKRFGDVFHLVACAPLEPKDYEVKTTLEDADVPGRCFTFPLIYVKAQNGTFNQAGYLGQLSPDSDRVLRTHRQFTHKCSDVSPERRRFFDIGGTVYEFKGMILQNDTSERNATKIGPVTSAIFIPGKHLMDVARAVAYTPDEVADQNSLLSIKELIDYTNMMRDASKITGEGGAGGAKYLPAYTPPLKLGWLWTGLANAFSTIVSWFVNPFLKLCMLIFVLVALIYSWVQVIKSLFGLALRHHRSRRDDCEHENTSAYKPPVIWNSAHEGVPRQRYNAVTCNDDIELKNYPA